MGKGRAAAFSRLETGRRLGGGGREHPRWVALHASLGKWPEAGAEGPTGDRVATSGGSSASECATRPGARLVGTWRGRNRLGPGRESATSACRPAPPGVPAAGPGVRPRRGPVVAGRPPGPLRICAQEKLLLDVDFEACGCFPCSKDHRSSANFIVGNPEISVTVKG